MLQHQQALQQQALLVAQQPAGGMPLAAPLMPPPTIAAFREKVKTLHFTNGADKPVVAGLYEKMLRAALGGSKELNFMKAGWGDAEAVAFAESLPQCTRLKELNLSFND